MASDSAAAAAFVPAAEVAALLERCHAKIRWKVQELLGGTQPGNAAKAAAATAAAAVASVTSSAAASAEEM